MGVRSVRVVLDGLLEAVLVRRHVDKHERFGVPTQRVLEKVRELGVAVGDVSVLVGCYCENVVQVAV